MAFPLSIQRAVSKPRIPVLPLPTLQEWPDHRPVSPLVSCSAPPLSLGFMPSGLALPLMLSQCRHKGLCTYCSFFPKASFLSSRQEPAPQNDVHHCNCAKGILFIYCSLSIPCAFPSQKPSEQPVLYIFIYFLSRTLEKHLAHIIHYGLEYEQHVAGVS